jgi:hypothetical protein
VVTWNVVPWYLGDGTKIRATLADDLDSARDATQELLSMLPEVRIVVLLGRPAAKAWRALDLKLASLEGPHPSPLNLNTRPERRGKLRQTLIRARTLAASN